jgi:NADP-dependent 3-hydroxy acid dehydrogenase YdfG
MLKRQGRRDLRSRRRDRQSCRTRRCARGAKLFLTGRLRAPVEAVAEDIVSAGGSAEAAELDALDEQAVGKHLLSVIDKAGGFDARCATVTAAARSEELS